MHKKILFPFSPYNSFNSGYTWAMELAARMNAAIFFFTAVPDDEKNKKAFLHRVSHSLLEAQGNYLQNCSREISPAKTERHIGEGDFTFSLSKFVRDNRFDIVVIDPNASALPQNALDFVVENSNGVIVLPEEKSTDLLNSEKKTTEYFYDVLHNSDLYKLPDNFFTTLGQDKRLFNYLRSFFRRNGNAAGFRK